MARRYTGPVTHGATFSLDWVGERHLRVRLDGVPEPKMGRMIARVYGALRDALPPGASVLAAFESLMVTFPTEGLDHAAAGEQARELVVRLINADDTPSAAATHEVPVCYEVEFAPDLGEVASLCGRTPAEVVELHRAGRYSVRFIGFSPGFPYLEGLAPALHVPRRESPRPRVPAGSVAIAGAQAGIYPCETPGGWRIIGRTPLRLFDAMRSPPALLGIGDEVRFVPISAGEFREIAEAGH